jgi:hypothetical protein
MAIDYRKSFPALYGSAPRSNDEIAEQQVSEWQQETVTAIRDVFARMRRHLDGQSAAMVGEVGHHELNQATIEWLALWADQERTMVAAVQSYGLANEARRWVLRQLERGGVDAADPLPKLVVWRHALPEIAKGTFCDADDDAIFRECLRQATIENAKAMPSPDTPKEELARLRESMEYKILTETERKVFDTIVNDGPLSGKELITKIGTFDQSTLTSQIIPSLRKKLGKSVVKNHHGVGYFIDLGKPRKHTAKTRQ